MKNIRLFFLVSEVVILFAPLRFLLKSKHEFSRCLHSFLFFEQYYSFPSAYKRHQKRSVRFAIFLVIILIATIVNVQFFL
jgi:hypothetical protein